MSTASGAPGALLSDDERSVADHELERLRAVASRTDYHSMTRLAVALYERGHDDREVIRSCYGVAFPDEFFLIARAHRHELDMDTNLPWQLTIPPAVGGPRAKPDSFWRTELQAMDVDPRLVPLAELVDDCAQHGGSLICYHLDELAAGRSTIFGLYGLGLGESRFAEDAAPVRYGPSLLTVLYEYVTDKIRVIEGQYADPSNARGFGCITSGDVEEVRRSVAPIQELLCRLVRIVEEAPDRT